MRVHGHESRGASHPNPWEAHGLIEAGGTGVGAGALHPHPSQGSLVASVFCDLHFQFTCGWLTLAPQTSSVFDTLRMT